jgi:protein ImuB
MFGALYAAEGTPPGALAEVAREFSPRIEAYGGSLAQARAFDAAQAREIVIDLIGLARLFGDAKRIAEELRRTAADRGIRVRVAIAGTRTAARLLVRHRAGVTVIDPGTEAVVLAPLPIALLGTLSDSPNVPNGPNVPNATISTFRRWGLRTLGDLAALPPDELVARLGRDGTMWQQLSRGEDARPLVPAVPEERFEQSLDLEWPIEDLEPLSFVLGRLMEPLSAHLEQRDRGAAVLHVRLHLIRTDGTTANVHERSLQLPIPIRDARTLRTLALLDLESHPPAAPIDRVTVAVDPTPGRIVQFSLLARPLPTPEQISTLMARLQALMGETRCGSPAMVDSWQPGACAMKPFAPVESSALHDHKPRRRASEPPRFVDAKDAPPVVALRRFRHPVPVRVHVQHDQPSSVMTMTRGLSGGGVEACAGPWRTSGGWWTGGASGVGRASGGEMEKGERERGERGVAWDRDEWDVTLASGPSYRLFRDRHADRWFIEGIVD